MSVITPSWEKDFMNLLGTERCIVFVNNTNDKYLSFDKEGYSTLKEFVNDVLHQNNFDVRFFNQFNGVSAEPCGESDCRSNPLMRRKSGVGLLAEKLCREMASAASPQAWVIENASHLVSGQNPEDSDSWLRIRETVFASDHRVIFFFDRNADVPRAFSPSDDFSKVIAIPKPDQPQRRQFIGKVFSHLSAEDIDYIADISDTLRLRKLEDIFALLTKTKSEPDRFDLKKAINLYINGYTESPWENLDKEKIEKLEEELAKKIKGQSEAISYVVEKTKAASTGVGTLLEGACAPKGVAVFGGPTGVGKTELAKQLTASVFGDENLLVRIDCGEYREEFTCQRLIGAPPGYVGYEAGGQLTNAVMERPFCIILIDEIEKAHPAFWQYLMTVLEDGRLTDGMGNVCSFRSCFIIFTTNLGANVVSADASREERTQAYQKAVEDYFKSINRREIYGRIEDSIVTFNPITDDVAKEIVEKKLHSIEESAKNEKQIKLIFSESVINELKELVGKTSEYGGRSIQKKLNDIIRPELSEIYFAKKISAGDSVIIDGIDYCSDNRVKLVYTVEKSAEEGEEEVFVPINPTASAPETDSGNVETVNPQRRIISIDEPEIPSFVTTRRTIAI